MAFELGVAVVVIAFDSGVLDRAVHPFDLPIRPGMVDLGEAMFDAVLPTVHREHVADVARRRTVGVAWREAELDAVVGQIRVDPVRYSCDQGDQEGRGCHPVRAVHQLHEGELARAIDCYEQVELALGGLNLGADDVEETDRVGLEPLLRLLVARDLR